MARLRDVAAVDARELQAEISRLQRQISALQAKIVVLQADLDEALAVKTFLEGRVR